LKLSWNNRTLVDPDAISPSAPMSARATPAGAPGRDASGPMLVTAPRGCAKPTPTTSDADRASAQPSGSRSM
jgi:hypothetical protein